MTVASFERTWLAAHPTPPAPRSVVALIRDGTLDAELAAHLWLLLEGRVPLVVAAGPSRAGKSTLLTALLDFLPPAAHRIVVRGEWEDFAWLEHAEPTETVVLASELSAHAPHSTWGRGARRLIRAAGSGFGLLATLRADSLEDMLQSLRRPPVGASEDELTALGVVLILALLPDPEGGSEARRRVIAAHYLRPVARDAGGHVQRLRPAVLATHDPDRDVFEHFAWGITPELALRIGRRAGDYEREHERRTLFLARLAEAGVEAPDEVRRAIAGLAMASSHPAPDPATRVI